MSQPSQVTTERRRFLIIDAIVLVAAAALMFSAERIVHEWGDPAALYGRREIRRIAWSLALAIPSLVLLVALLARPGDRRRLRHGAPGLYVHLALAAVLVVRCAGWLAQAVIVQVY